MVTISKLGPSGSSKKKYINLEKISEVIPKIINDFLFVLGNMALLYQVPNLLPG